jgi:glycerol kinase
VHPAIVWQDRRTADRCDAIRATASRIWSPGKPDWWSTRTFLGHQAGLAARPGTRARERAEAGELCFGTVDSYLIWRLTGGAVHATDATNASRTMLFDIGRQRWSPELLDYLEIPRALLPEVRDCAGDFGVAEAALVRRGDSRARRGR